LRSASAGRRQRTPCNKQEADLGGEIGNFFQRIGEDRKQRLSYNEKEADFGEGISKTYG
uniref:Gastrin domain-containing protein n=1 Tax=Anisakis simplex TaxID=6269 RepID=A0A0M3K6X8_ANISI